MEKYIAFLRGINVGGHHKIPMAELRKEFEKLKTRNIQTLLNSGNVIFESDPEISEGKIEKQLESTFGFPVPTIIRKAQNVLELVDSNPFINIVMHKEIRLYVTFLKSQEEMDLTIPWKSEDGSFQILEKNHNSLFSVLDLSLSGSTKAMDILEKKFGRHITTRNFNTLERIKKLIGKET